MSQENDELVPLYHAQRLTTSEQSIDIIIVPGTLPDCQPDEYETKYSWIKSLIASTEVDTRVFLFYCHVATGSRELGDQLNSQSEYLRTALHNICVGSESQRRRLVFICHGDGGLIVKTMLTLDFKLDRNHEEVTSGLIFLETPHATRYNEEDDEMWDEDEKNIRGNRPDLEILHLDSSDCELVARTCREFDELQLCIPILTLRVEEIGDSLRLPKGKWVSWSDGNSEFNKFLTFEPISTLLDVKVGGEIYGCIQDLINTTSMRWVTSRARQLSDPAKSLLKVLSLLDPDRIPEELLTEGARNVRFYSIDNYPVEAIDYFKARNELVNSTLISRNSEISEIQIRRFVQSAVIQTMKESYDGLSPAFGATTRLLPDIWPYATRLTCDRVESDPKAEKLIAHILRIEALFGDDIRSGKISGTPESGYLFCGYARYASDRGLQNHIEGFARLALVILNGALAGRGYCDKQKTIFWVVEAYHHLALAAIFTGSSDGLLHVGTWINVMKSRRVETYKLPSKVSLLASGYHQLGINYAHKDQIGEAIKNWQESIDIYRKVNNAPRFSGTWPSISLEYAYTLLNSPDEGEKVLKPVLEEHEEVLGKDDLTTQESGHIWRAMGNIHNAQERFPGGLEYHQRSLNNLRSTLGEKHHFTGDAFYCLGVDYWQQKDKIQALQNLTAAIKAFRSGTHTKAQLARAIWKKGCILKTEENDCQAQELLMEAQNLYHELVPVNSCAIEELEDENWTKLLVYWSR